MPHQQHQHAHGQPDWAQFAEQLTAGPELHAEVNRAAFDWLAGLLGPVDTVLDLGAGAAVISVQLADAFAAATVYAVEDNAELVRLATRTTAGQERVKVQRGSLPADIDTLPAAELIWMNGVAHHLEDAPGTLRRLVARLRPGGAVVLGEGGLPPQFFPDGPDHALLLRMEAARARRAAEHGNPMGIHGVSEAWPDVLRRAGCVEVHTRSFLLDRPAPLEDRERQWVAGRLGMARDFAGDLLDADDRARLDALADPDPSAKHSVLHREDLFVLTANTVHVGRRDRGARS